MRNRTGKKTSRTPLPPLIVIGAVLVLLPIFVFIILQNINRQESFGTRLLLEKGAALIRSFEAGTRAGMMGRGWGNRHLQQLLSETAQQPDIAYLLLVDSRGRTIAHNDMNRIGKRHQPEVDPQEVSASDEPLSRFVVTEEGVKIFEVYKQFRPSMKMKRERGPFHGMMGPRGPKGPGRGDGRHDRMKRFFERFGFAPPEQEFTGPFIPTIILGFNLQTLEAARTDDRNRAIITGLILFLVSAFGIILLFLFYNYRSARSSLSRIRAFSENLLDNMPVGLVAFNNDFQITSLNSFAVSLLGLQLENVIGKTAGSILPASLWEHAQNQISQADLVEKEINCRLSSGQLIPLEIDISQFKSRDDGPVSYILMFKDLSQVKALQKEIARSQRLASIGSLAAGVAHEIRNPLSSIKGFATYFKERYPDIQQDQKIARIMIEEVERLNRVVGQLLELSKPVVINATQVDLNMLVDDSVKLIEQAAAEKNIEISAGQEPLGSFALDGDKIKQVLLNLYLNAMEAMPDGGRLDVLLDLSPGRDRLDISVTDTGVGISQANLGNIYDPYYTTKQAGTGLGLAVVHNIVEAHGGTMTVESEQGKGSRFNLSIPDLSGESSDEQ